MSVGDRLTYLFEGLQRGQFSNANASIIPDGYCASLVNVSLNKFGMLQKIPGRSNTAGGLTSGQLRRLLFYAPAGGTREFLAYQGTALHNWPNSGTWATITGATGLADEPVDLIQAGSYVFLLKKGEVCRYWDGTIITAFTDTNTDPPKVKYGIYMLGWMLMWDADLLYYPTNGTPAVGWNRTSKALAVGLGEGGDATGLKQWSNQDLILTKEGRIYSVTINNATPTNWTITPITDDIGCVSGRTMSQFGEEFFFLAQDGIRSLTQSAQDKKRGAALPLSWPIQDVIDTINWQYAKDVACATQWKGEYWLSFPTAASQVNNKTVIYSPRSQGFTTLDQGFADFNVGRFSNSPRLYSGRGVATGGVDLEDDGFDDRGSAKTWTVKTKRVNGNNGSPAPHIYKRGGELEAFFESTGSYVVSVYASIDGGSNTLLGTMTLTGSLPQLSIDLPFNLADQSISRKKFYLDLLGRWRDVDFTFECTDLEADVRLIRAILSTIPADYVRGDDQ